MKVDVDLEPEYREVLEILRWEERKEDSEEWVGDQVVSMLSASSSQDARALEVGHQVNHSHGLVEYYRGELPS
jgi:hypothetical protein